MDNNLEVQAVFLDRNDYKNSKTFYYVRLAVHHNIPLIVRSEKRKISLYRECYKLSGATIPRNFSIYNIQDRYDFNYLKQYMENGKKVICDDQKVRRIAYSNLEFYLLLFHGGEYTDDQIRNIVLTDLSEGKTYYESP